MNYQSGDAVASAIHNLEFVICNLSMKILGIDPGLRATGYGCVEIRPNDVCLRETGTIEPNVKDAMEHRIARIYANLSDIIAEQKPSVVVVEKLYSHTVHPMTAAKLGHVRGVIFLLCSQQKIPLAELSPKRVRQALTGNGNATKQQTLRSIANFFHIDENKLSLDASDALAMALGYAHMNRTAAL
jgi:crossover junction endodeoxyribonuclease RuvC